MNSSENDDYWNESQLSKFNFEHDNIKGDPVLLTDVIDTSFGNSSEDSVHYSFDSSQNIRIEVISNYLSDKSIGYILDFDSEKSEFCSFHNISVDDEIRSLRRQLKERWIPPSVESTINRILLGQPYSFELYRSLTHKKSLLKTAVKSSDGDAILAVVVFLVKTLKKNLFHQLLMENPTAISHYVHYLYTRRQMSELNDLLEALGRTKDAMMKQLSVASQNPARLQQRLRLMLKNYSYEPWDFQIVDNYAKLVDWQVAASEIINDRTIIGESAVNSLKLNTLRKLSIPLPVDGKNEIKPSDFAKYFNISEKQSSVALVRVNAELQQWDAVEQLFVVKGWVGGKKLNQHLPVELLEELPKYGATGSFMDKILQLIVDNDKRTEIASKLGRHKIVIDTFSKKKDKHALLQYMAPMDNQSADYIYAQTVLQMMGSRWKG